MECTIINGVDELMLSYYNIKIGDKVKINPDYSCDWMYNHIPSTRIVLTVEGKSDDGCSLCYTDENRHCYHIWLHYKRLIKNDEPVLKKPKFMKRYSNEKEI